MSDEAFGVVEPDALDAGENLPERFAFLVIPTGGSSRMGTDDLDLLGREAAAA